MNARACPRQRFLVLHNPAAGRNNAALARAVERELQQRGAHVTLSALPADLPDPDELESYDAIVISGGDGSIRAFAESLSATGIPIGVIPNGTGNVLAEELLLPTTAPEIAELLIHGATNAVRGGLANNAPFLLMFGAGFDGEVIGDLSRSGVRNFGKLAYARPLLRALLKKPQLFEISIDGKPSQASWILVSNAAHYGGHFRLGTASDIRDPALVALVSHATTRRERVLELLRLLIGRLASAPTMEVRDVTDAEVTAAGAAAQFDGEPLGTGTYRIRRHDHETLVIAPPAVREPSKAATQTHTRARTTQSHALEGEHAMMKSKSGPRSWSSNALIVLVAVFVAAFCNTGFFTSAFAVLGTSAGKLAFVGSLFFQIASIFVLVLAAVAHRVLLKPVLIVFLLLSSFLTYFTTKYGTIIDHQMIANLLETDTAEAGDLFNVQLLLYIFLLGIVPSIAIWRATVHRPHWKAETIARVKLIAAAGCVLLASYAPFTANNASLFREHRDVTEKVVPTYALYSVGKYTSRSLKAPNTERTIVGADAKIPPTDVHRELIVMVVGETARADHWGLNGYAHDTTPLLRRAGVTNFPDFWSCDTSTAKSVPCMFSNMGRAHFSRDKVVGRDNALDVLARSGVSVLWRDNNSSSKGVADRVTYQDFKTSALNPACEDGECRDIGMLNGLQNYIDAQQGDILIVLHQMGNHGPAYYKRYPKEFERFTPVCKTNDLGSCTSEEITNAYDNALLYTDYFLSEVIALLKRNDDTFETAMFYVSDHGESLGEYGMYLHAAPYALAPDTQKHVPAVMWFGENVKHDIRMETVDARSRERWSHDNVFSTLLGMFEIRSDAYQARMDILERMEEETSDIPEQPARAAPSRPRADLHQMGRVISGASSAGG